MKKTLITIAITALLTAAILATRTYHGVDGAAGIAWNWGGFEILPVPALFICPGNTENGIFTPNPIAPYFPDLLTDC